MPGLTGMTQAWTGRSSLWSRKSAKETASPRSLSFCDARSLLWSRRTAIGFLAGVFGLLTLAAYSVPRPLYHARAEIQLEALQGVAPPSEDTAKQLAQDASNSLGDAATRLRLAQQMKIEETKADVFGVNSLLHRLSLAPAQTASVEAVSETRRKDPIENLASQFTIEHTADGLAVSATARGAGSAETLANTMAEAIVERFDRSRPAGSVAKPSQPSPAATTPQATAPRLESGQRTAAVSADTADAKLLRQMDGELTTLRARVVTLRHRADLLRRAQATGVLSRTTLQSLGSPIIEQLCRQQAELRRARAGFAQDLGPRHPTMARFEQDLTAGERRIARELDKLAGAAGRDLHEALSREAALAEAVGRLQALAEEPNLAPTIQPDQPATNPVCVCTWRGAGARSL